MASLLHQHGHYYLQFFDASRSPRRKRVALRTTQKRTAQALQRKLEHDHALGRFDPWSHDAFAYDQPAEPLPVLRPATLRETVESFLDYLRAHGRQATTLRTYTTLLRAFSAGVGDGTPFASVESRHIRAYVWSPDVAAATRYTRYRHVKAFFARSVRALPGDVRNPMDDVEAPPNRDRLPKVVSAADLKAVCEVFETEYVAKRAAKTCREGEVIWFVPLFRFAFYSGLRASELGRLRWGHVDLQLGTLTLLQQKSQREQVVPLARQALAILKAMGEGAPESYVFGAPGHRSGERSIQAFVWNIGAAFRRAKVKAKIARPICVHGLRHGFCTALAQSGANMAVIQRAARHASVGTTMRYVNLADEMVRQSMDEAFGRPG